MATPSKRWPILIGVLLLAAVGLWVLGDDPPQATQNHGESGAGLRAQKDPLDLKRGSIPGNRDGTPGQTPTD